MSLTPRQKNAIEGSLTGWYTAEWGNTICWAGDQLMVKSRDLADEIVFNLQPNFDLEIRVERVISTDHSGWSSLSFF